MGRAFKKASTGGATAGKTVVVKSAKEGPVETKASTVSRTKLECTVLNLVGTGPETADLYVKVNVVANDPSLGGFMGAVQVSQNCILVPKMMMESGKAANIIEGTIIKFTKQPKDKFMAGQRIVVSSYNYGAGHKGDISVVENSKNNGTPFVFDSLLELVHSPQEVLRTEFRLAETHPYDQIRKLMPKVCPRTNRISTSHRAEADKFNPNGEAIMTINEMHDAMPDEYKTQ